MKIYLKDQIGSALNLEHDIEALLLTQQQAFIDFSNQQINIPLPLQLKFEQQNGDCHVKGGFKINDDTFIIKIVTGFYNNPSLNLPVSDGAMLIFSQTTGQLKGILYNQGFLTILRTALAAAVTAKLTPWKIKNIAIIGTGQLAEQVIKVMRVTYPDATIYLYGRSFEKTKALAATYPNITPCETLEEALRENSIAITTTASATPFIHPHHLKDNMHIIALGADEQGKQECSTELFKLADHIITDSKAQAQKFGEIFYALQNNVIIIDQINELGSILQNPSILTEGKLIITDLTGIAAQDIAMARFVLMRLDS